MSSRPPSACRVRSAARIAAIDGVQLVDTRIVRYANVDVPGFHEPVIATLVSVPDAAEPMLNRPTLRRGAPLSRGRIDEAWVSEAFAEAHRLDPGDHLRVLMNGRSRDIEVAGIALSPEFVYSIGPGALMPDAKRYGVLWMKERELAAAFDLDGAFDDVTLTAAAGRVGPRRDRGTRSAARALWRHRCIRAPRPAVELVRQERDRAARNDGAHPAVDLSGGRRVPHQRDAGAAGLDRTRRDRPAESLRLLGRLRRLALRETRRCDDRGRRIAGLGHRLGARALDDRHVCRTLSLPIAVLRTGSARVSDIGRDQRRRCARRRNRRGQARGAARSSRSHAPADAASVPSSGNAASAPDRLARPADSHHPAAGLTQTTAGMADEPRRGDVGRGARHRTAMARRDRLSDRRRLPAPAAPGRHARTDRSGATTDVVRSVARLPGVLAVESRRAVPVRFTHEQYTRRESDRRDSRRTGGSNGCTPTTAPRCACRRAVWCCRARSRRSSTPTSAIP